MIWFIIPSKDTGKAIKTARIWRARGYGVGIFFDGDEQERILDFDESIFFLFGHYESYPKAVNALAHQVLIRNPSVTWIVTGGDDVYPDPAWHPEDIAHRCEQRFAGTFGVMQPGGQSGDDNPDQWAVSPWIGREWIEQAYSSPQALSEHYFHYFTDAELTAAARRLGVYWFWKDVSQLHDSWRTRGDRTPPHLQKAMEEYPKDRETFLLRQELKFPGLQHRAGLV